ncbi:MAG: type IV secretory system conjugative DNA transfer family protein [Nitrospinales bacterium]
MSLLDDLPRGNLKSRKEQKVPSEAFADPDAVKKNLQYTGAEFLAGAIDSTLIGLPDERHITSIAGNGAGKSVMLGANLMHYLGSVFVVDPKGEMANLTAKRRTKMGHSVFVVDPFSRCSKGIQKKYSASFNPMSVLSEKSPSLLEDVESIAESLIISNPTEDQFWNDSAKILLETAILHVATSPEYEGKRNLNSVYEVLSGSLETSENNGDDDE